MTDILSVGDYVKVLRKEGRVRAGTVWQITDVITDEDTGEVFYLADSDIQGWYGHDLSVDNVEKLTENIPYRIYAELKIEVEVILYGDSLAEVTADARENPIGVLLNSPGTTYTQVTRIEQVTM